ncbi:hypothetical protein [Sodalis glossinidius]|uniref:hypothetical protein n=1 Tax=Sodalis glossinidius TaxID=63612 RepID=UPI0008709052
METKDFRLNFLANQYSAAMYAAIQKENSGDWFTVNAGEQDIRVDIIGGISGVRDLIDAYGLEAMKLNYPQWESLAIALLTKSLKGKRLTKAGREIWQSMVNDMGATVIARGT